MPHAFAIATGSVLQPHEDLIIEPARGRVWLNGFDELRLELAAQALQEHFATELVLGGLCVEYLETPTRSIEREDRIPAVSPTFARL